MTRTLTTEEKLTKLTRRVEALEAQMATAVEILSYLQAWTAGQGKSQPLLEGTLHSLQAQIETHPKAEDETP